MSNSQTSRLPWDVALFFTLYTVLPNYFAVEVSGSLPLLTASRVLLLLMGIMLIIRNRQAILNPQRWSLKSLNLGLTEDRFLRWSILIYFVILIFVNVCFLTTTSEAIKETFTLVAEQYLLIWLLTTVIDTRKKLIDGLRLLVYVSGFMGIIASISCIVDYNLFHCLKTVNREMMMTDYYRQGLLRAASSFNHPVYYGAFCAIMIPLSMYFVEHDISRKLRIVSCSAIVMNFVGLILSNSRGSILAIGCAMCVIFLLRLIRRKLKKFFKTYLPILATALATLILVTSLTSAGIQYLSSVTESITSTLSSFIPQISTEKGNAGETSPADDTTDEVEFGNNPNGLRSRTVQLTGIYWTLQQSPILGLGPGAHTRGLVRYWITDHWQVVKSFDIAPVAMVCQFGLLGLLGYAMLYSGFLKTLLSKCYRKDPLMHHLFLCYLTYGLCLMSISDLDKVEWVLLGAVICLANILRREYAQDATSLPVPDGQ